MLLDDVERLYQAHARSLYRYVAYQVEDQQLAEDVLSDVFERALRAPRLRRRGAAAEKAWLYRTALNALRDQVRRRGAENRAVERMGELHRLDEPTSFDERVEDRQLLTAALAELSEDEQEALALRYGAGLSLRELAAVTGESATTTEGRVYRGLRKLRQLLSE